MKDSLKIGLGVMIGIFGVIACGACAFITFSAGGIALLASAIYTPTPLPTTAPIQPHIAPSSVPPLPGKLGSSITHNNLLITLSGYEFSGGYQHSFGFEDKPPEGAKFLWIHVIVENIDDNSTYTPMFNEFAILYEQKQIDADFYLSEDRVGYPPYPGGEIYPGATKDGWVRFTLPVSAEPPNILVVMMPFDLFSDENYTWTLAP